MNLLHIRKATILLKDYINGCEYTVLKNGEFGLQVHAKDGTQKVFKDIQHVIDWVQVQKIKQFL